MTSAPRSARTRPVHGVFRRYVADDDKGREIGTERVLIIILHVLDRERFDAGGRRFTPSRVLLRKQRDGERMAGNMVGTLQFAGDRSGQLWLDDFKILFGQRRRKLVVGEQLHTAFKLIG